MNDTLTEIMDAFKFYINYKFNPFGNDFEMYCNNNLVDIP